MLELSVYERIMRAARRGTGTHLSADDVWAMSCDDAIARRAENDESNRKLYESVRKENERRSRVVQPKVRKKK